MRKRLDTILLRANEARRIIPGIVRTMIETYADSMRDVSFDIRFEMTHGREIYGFTPCPVCESTTCTIDRDERDMVWLRTERVAQLTPVGVWLLANWLLLAGTVSTIWEEIVWVFGGSLPQWKI